MASVDQAARELGGCKLACEALGVSRATYYRSRRPLTPPRLRPRPPRALRDEERQVVIDTLNSERFVDQPRAEVHATLLDEGTYLCSTRTMYRIPDAKKLVRERRDQLRHPHYEKPESGRLLTETQRSSIGKRRVSASPRDSEHVVKLVLLAEAEAESRTPPHGTMADATAMLLGLLTLKFGPVPEAAVQRLRAARIDELDGWAERILTATSLEGVLDGRAHVKAP